MIKLTVAKMKPITFIGVGLGLWLVSAVSGELADALPTGSAVRLVAGLGATVSGVGLAALLLWGGWSLVVRLVNEWFKTETVELGENAGPTSTALGSASAGLAKTLAALEEESGQAATLLSDAEQYAAHLAKLSRAFAAKGETLRLESVQLAAARQAIDALNGAEIAHAAGGLADPHLASLLSADLPPTDDYWEGVAIALARQQGALEQWATAHRTFARKLLIELSHHKARLVNLQGRLSLFEAARPLAQIEAGLTEAEQILRMQGSRRPELRALQPDVNVLGG